MNRTLRSLALLAVAGALCPLALAQVNTVKLGGTNYTTHAKTTGVTGIGIPAGADADTGDASTLLITYERLVAPQVGIELALGIPPRINADATGSVAFLGHVLSSRIVAPTLFANYHFGASGQALRPYLGLGVNFTRFVDLRNPYGWQVSLSDSWGLAAQAGLNYALGGPWGLFASVAVLQVKTDLVAAGATVLRTTIDFRPVVYSAGVAYRF